ncbi:efflux RND transporter periplasmic adaptor subunit [Candidatus Woesebacteria bacterium]|nr:efflux RND transporter periplasmic adaptor subunit [Candidatus Woesebacteria bacterium]
MKRFVIKLLSIIRTKKFLLVFVIICAIAAFIWFRERNQPVKVIETHTVERETLRKELNVSGSIEALEAVDLHFQTGGRLTWVGVKEGDMVKKNQGIASLDQRQLQKNIQKYLNTYDKERRDFEQTNADYEDNSVDTSAQIREEARRVLENSQFDLNNSVLDVELQTISKEYAYLYTPIAGIVTRIDAPTAGMNILPTTTFQIVNTDSLYFSLSVDQTEVVDLQEGMIGTILIDAFPDQKFSGEILSIGYTPQADEAGTVYEVKVALSGSDRDRLRIGMTGDVSFVLAEYPNSLSIPLSYLVQEDADYVMIMAGGKQVKQAVEIGREVGDMIEVLSGLSEGNIIYLPE